MALRGLFSWTTLFCRMGALPGGSGALLTMNRSNSEDDGERDLPIRLGWKRYCTGGEPSVPVCVQW